MKSHKSRVKNKRRKYKKSKLIRQSGGFYNNTQHYIDTEKVKRDLKNLVASYAQLEDAYKNKHNEVMILYKSYTDLYQRAKSSNNRPDEKKYKSKLFSINNNIITEEAQYNKNKDNILSQINNIRDYIRQNKEHFIQKLGLKKMVNSQNINNQNGNNNDNDYKYKTVDELKIIEETNNTVKCPKCRKVGMGVIMIPEPKPKPVPRPKIIKPVVNQHIYVQQPRPKYKCPVCMHMGSYNMNNGNNQQTQILNQHLANLTNLLQQQVNKKDDCDDKKEVLQQGLVKETTGKSEDDDKLKLLQQLLTKETTPQDNKAENQKVLQQLLVKETTKKSRDCVTEVLKNPKPGVDIQTQIQQCMMQEKVSLNEIDTAYLKKHNELMTLYKAYQNLYVKVNEYKDKLDNVKSVRVSTILTREQLAKMVDDQEKIMSSIGEMQKNMVEKGVLTPSETVDVKNISGKQIQDLNTNLGKQLNSIVSTDQSNNVDNKTKKHINNLVKQQQNNKDKEDEFKGKIMQIMGNAPIPTHEINNANKHNNEIPGGRYTTRKANNNRQNNAVTLRIQDNRKKNNNNNNNTTNTDNNNNLKGMMV